LTSAHQRFRDTCSQRPSGRYRRRARATGMAARAG